MTTGGRDRHAAAQHGLFGLVITFPRAAQRGLRRKLGASFGLPSADARRRAREPLKALCIFEDRRGHGSDCRDARRARRRRGPSLFAVIGPIAGVARVEMEEQAQLAASRTGPVLRVAPEALHAVDMAAPGGPPSLMRVTTCSPRRRRAMQACRASEQQGEPSRLSARITRFAEALAADCHAPSVAPGAFSLGAAVETRIFRRLRRRRCPRQRHLR